jgi:hypothetical protein
MTKSELFEENEYLWSVLHKIKDYSDTGRRDLIQSEVDELFEDAAD